MLRRSALPYKKKATEREAMISIWLQTVKLLSRKLENGHRFPRLELHLPLRVGSALTAATRIITKHHSPHSRETLLP
jgi:hypothetical protein